MRTFMCVMILYILLLPAACTTRTVGPIATPTVDPVARGSEVYAERGTRLSSEFGNNTI